jgi:Ca2+/Na+ antiporter
MLTQEQEAFVNKRRRLATAWPLFGAILALAVIGLGLWMFIRTPMLINPVEAMARVEDPAMDRATLSLMAMMLPMVVGALLLVMLALVAFAFAQFRNERRLIELIDGLNDSSTSQEKSRT